MITDSALRQAMADQAETANLDRLVSVENIATAGTRRTRRNRVLTGAGALALVLFAFLGVKSIETEQAGLTVATEISDEVAERIAGQSLRPDLVVSHRDSFVGLAPASLAPSADSVGDGMVVVESSDGITWELVDGAPAFSTASAMITEYDGTVHIVATGAEGLVHTVSNDLSDWRDYARALPAALQEVGNDLVVDSLRVGQNGVVAVASHVPGMTAQHAAQQSSFRSAGLDPSELCFFGIDGEVSSYRVCGTSERVEQSFDSVRIDGFSVERHVFSGALDGPLLLRAESEAVGSPLADTDTDSYVDRNGRNIGVQTTTDGRSSNLDLGPLYPTADLREFRIQTPIGGPAGWAFSAQRWGNLRPPVVESPVIVSDGNYTFTTEVPFGSASLITIDGGVVRTWDWFEMNNLAWSGVEVSPTGVAVLAETGDELVSFSHEQWADAFAPDRQADVTDIWFSADGQDWGIVKTTDSLVTVVAVGDGQLIVESNGAGDVYATGPVPPGLQEVVTIELANTVPATAIDSADEEPIAAGGIDIASEATDSVSDGVGSGFQETQPSGLPGARDVEQVSVVRPGLGISMEADQLYLERELGDLSDTAVEHVSTMTSGGVTVDVFIERLSSDPGYICYRNSRITDGRRNGGGSSCGSEDFRSDPDVKVLFADFDRGLRLQWAPEGAAWVVIERTDGSFVKANVFGVTSAAAWPREFGRAAHVSIQDADSVELWASPVGE